MGCTSCLRQYISEKVRDGEVLEDPAHKSAKVENKDENKEVSLGTSKTNYIDPRVSVALGDLKADARGTAPRARTP